MSMLFGMATKKVTVTLDEVDLARVKSMVAEGRVSSVSRFVQHAVRMSLDDVTEWDTEVALALAATGGSLTAVEQRWADGLLAGHRGVAEPS